MTSTISSNKKNFKKLFKWALSRNKAIIIVYSILMAIGIVIDLYVMIMISGLRSATDQSVNAYGMIGYFSITMAQIGALLFTLISAVNTFSFLHNKRSTDMFGALPVTRGTMYLSHLLGGITAVASPFVIGSFIVMGFTCRSTEYFFAELCFILFGIMGIAASYSFTALIAYCCGTGRDTTIITIGANAIYSGVIVLFFGAASSMLPGVSFDSAFYTPIMTLFAPYMFSIFLEIYYSGGQTTAMWMTIIWDIIFTAGMIFIGMRAARTRKAETAQNDFNVKWLPVVIKAGISVLCGGLAGLGTASASEAGYSNMFIFAFWYIMIGFAAFFILHLIFQRGLKGKFLPSLIVYCCTTVGTLGIIFGLTTGLGIDTYVPAAGNVSSVSIGNTEFKEYENIETITQIHKIIAEGIPNQYQRPYFLGHSYTDEYYYGDSETWDGTFNEKYPLTTHVDFNLTYRKIIGISTVRCYYITPGNVNYYDCGKIEELLKKLYNSEEYKKMRSSVLWEADGAKINGMAPKSAELSIISPYSLDPEYGYGYDYDETSTVKLSTDEKFISGLYKALREDILADKEYYKNYVGEHYSFDTFDGDDYMRLTVYYPGRVLNYSHDPGIVSEYYSGSNYFNLRIPYAYKNTVKYLEDNGVNTGRSKNIGRADRNVIIDNGSTLLYGQT